MRTSTKVLGALLLFCCASIAYAQTNWLSARQAEFAAWQRAHPNVEAQISDLKTKTAALIAVAGVPNNDIAAAPIIRRVPGAITEIWDAPAAPQMVVIPAGSYTMGSPLTEELRQADEDQHRVTINYAFAMGKYPVTVDEYAQFVAETQHPDGPSCFSFTDAPPMRDTPGVTWRNPGFKQTGSDPVVCVSWEDAQAYVQWLSKKTGKSYRLPSESEWQYAARGGTTTRYYWGEQSSHEHANYGADTDIYCGVNARPGTPCVRAPLVAGRDKWIYTAPVGSFPPNPFGLYDMLGNVWQFTEDCYSKDFGPPADGSALTCDRHSTLGGGWLFGPRALRAAHRGKDLNEQRIFGDGFRVARTL